MEQENLVDLVLDRSCCVFEVALPTSDSGLKDEATRHIIYYIGVMNNPFDGYVCFSG